MYTKLTATSKLPTGVIYAIYTQPQADMKPQG